MATEQCPTLSMRADAADAVSGVVVLLVAMQLVPLVWAYTDGLRLIGAELDTTASQRYAAARRWIGALVPGAATVAFLAGRSAGVAYYVAPLAIAPPQHEVGRTGRARRSLVRAGVAVAWLAAAALAGTPVFPAISHAIAVCAGLRSETGACPLSALPGGNGRLHIGVAGLRSIVDKPSDLPVASTAFETMASRIFSENAILVDLLLSEQGEFEAYLADWAAQVTAPPLEEIPTGLLEAAPVMADPRLDHLALPSPAAIPKLPWVPRMPQQRAIPEGACPRRAADLMPAASWRRVERWLLQTLADLVCIRDEGAECERKRPGVLVVGQDELYPWARGIVWDFRNSPAECGSPLDFHAPLVHTLHTDYLTQRLINHPNQQLVSFIAEGVRPLADVELQTVLVPHLMSLAFGFPSVVKELKRMTSPELGWYSLHGDMPFWPMYSLGEGCVPRKLEDRWRRCEEGGGPRKETFDRSNLRALSLNEASRIHHFPAHFSGDTRPEWAEYLRARKLPASAEAHAAVAANRGTKWHRQQMPRLSDAMKALLVLKRAGFLLKEPVYLFGDDVKDYFNHFTHASEVLHHMNTVFLEADDFQAQPQYAHESGSLVFVHEKRMGFGLHPNSIIAQDFSEALNIMLREDVDAVEDPILEADPRPAAQAWLQTRRELEAKVGGHQRRLYFVLMYCDDNIIGVVGAERAVRLLRRWRRLTQDAGLIMAIPEKRSLGVWCKWIGAIVFAVIGLVVIPKAKLLRATATIRSLLDTGIPFSEYRSLMGLLEHLRDVARLPRRYTHALYAPHGREGESQEGPNAVVRPKVFMAVQFQRWLEVLNGCGGCSVFDVLRRRDIASAHAAHFLAASDAATDSEPPGLGGYMHGMYWQFSVPQEDLKWLHITVLELLACVFSTIIFARVIPPRSRLTLVVDATSAYYTLAEESEKSEVLIYTHHTALAHERFRVAAGRCDIIHGAGDFNIAGDAASRSKWDVLQAFAAALRVRTCRLEVPQVCADIYADVLQHAKSRGSHVKMGKRPPEARMSKATLSMLEQLEAVPRHDPRGGPSSHGFLAQEVIEHVANGFVRRLQAARGGRNADCPARPPTARRSFLASLKAMETRAHPTARTTSRPTASSLTAASVEPSAMQSTLVGGVRLATPTKPRADTGGERRAQRERDRLRAAIARADALADPGATPEQRARLAAGIAHSTTLAQFGAAEGTLEKDDCAWAQWRIFSEVYGFDPVVRREQAVQQPDLLATRLGLFLLWVYPRIQGRGRADAHPRAVLNNYPGAIARVLRRDHKLPTPRACTYEAEAKGLLRGYKRVYGTLALAPRRRQPMTRSLWAAVEALRRGQPLRGRAPWLQTARHIDLVGLRLGRVLSASAHRLGEIVAYSEEVSYLTRENVTYRIGGIVAVDPTREQLLAMKAGDLVYLAPCSSKPDQFGEEHCTFPTVLLYDGTHRSAAGAIRDIELEAPCRGSARRSQALFADEQGAPYSYYALNNWLRSVLTALIGAEAAAAFSWHSFRIELACLLRAAGCPDSMIQLLCRWKCPASVQKYAQVGSADNIRWIQMAHAVHFDAVRTNNMVQLDNADAYAELADKAFKPTPAPARSLPSIRSRAEVQWGDEWFAGVFTSRRRGPNTEGRDAWLYRILYDATGRHPSHAAWHDLTEVAWRALPASA